MPEPEPPIAAAINRVADAINEHNERQAEIIAGLSGLMMAIKGHSKACWGKPPDMPGD